MLQKNNTLAGIVGTNIMVRRKKRKLTQERLAEMVGIGQQSLSRMEKGHIAPRFDRLQAFASALGCSVADLFKQDDGGIQPSSINEIIRPLSADSQQAIINVVTEMTQAMLKLENRSCAMSS